MKRVTRVACFFDLPWVLVRDVPALLRYFLAVITKAPLTDVEKTIASLIPKMAIASFKGRARIAFTGINYSGEKVSWF